MGLVLRWANSPSANDQPCTDASLLASQTTSVPNEPSPFIRLIAAHVLGVGLEPHADPTGIILGDEDGAAPRSSQSRSRANSKSPRTLLPASK